MTQQIPKIKTYSFTLDCPDPAALAKFYAALLQWDVVFASPDFVCVGAPGAQQGEYPVLLFQRNELFVSPVWPEEPGAQQQMAHLDLAVEDLDAAAAYAISCGATVADKQLSADWRVMRDPVGHPFCLCPMKDLFAAEHFALR